MNPRGFGGSQGTPQASLRSEHEDYYDAIEWAAAQGWSTGSIGTVGISYYAMAQWGAAALNPPHLKAVVPWEGLADPYRDIMYRGGLRAGFGVMFMFMIDQLRNAPMWRDSELLAMLRHPLYDDHWRARGGDNDLTAISAPLLSVGNLSDVDLHLRGNVEGFMAASSPNKRLRLYAGTHWGSAYQPWANRVVLRFFDHYLKGVDTGLESELAVDIDLRTGPASFTHVYGDTYPLPQTQWTKYHLDAATKTLGEADVDRAGSAVAEPSDVGGRSYRVTFRTEPLTEAVGIAGPVTARVWISSSTRDADISVELNDLDEAGRPTLFPYYFHDSDDEPVSRGWLRASHRALDPARSLPHRPFHLHTRKEPLTPGRPVALDIEVWSTSVVFQAGHRIELIVHAGPHKRRGERGKLIGRNADSKRSGAYRYHSRGTGTVTIHTGGEHASWLELPVIPTFTGATHEITIRDGAFVPATATGLVGDRFEVVNRSSGYHTVTETSPLRLWDSQLIRGTRSHNPEAWPVTPAWAGTYRYRDEVAGETGTIEIVPTVEPANDGTLEVTIATRPAPEGVEFDVELRSGDGDCSRWNPTWSPHVSACGRSQVRSPPSAPGSSARPKASRWTGPRPVPPAVRRNPEPSDRARRGPPGSTAAVGEAVQTIALPARCRPAGDRVPIQGSSQSRVSSASTSWASTWSAAYSWEVGVPVSVSSGARAAPP